MTLIEINLADVGINKSFLTRTKTSWDAFVEQVSAVFAMRWFGGIGVMGRRVSSPGRFLFFMNFFKILLFFLFFFSKINYLFRIILYDVSFIDFFLDRIL